MTQEQKPQRTVTAKVVGHEEYNGKPLTKLDVPAWGSKYPIPLYGIDPDAQAVLPISETLTVVLQADRQKENTDASKPWNFFWSFVRIAGDGDVPSKPGNAAPTTQPAQSASGQPPSRDPGTEFPPDPTDEGYRGAPARSSPAPEPAARPAVASAPTVSTDLAIRRAVALKAAVDFAGAFEGLNEGDVLATAQQFEEWLARE